MWMWNGLFLCYSVPVMWMWNDLLLCYIVMWMWNDLLFCFSMPVSCNFDVE